MNKLKSARCDRGESRPSSEAGFTLIEMMISIAIGLGILAALVGVLATNSGNSRTNDRTAELMTNGRYALNSMKQELRQAGFRAYTWADPNTPSALGSLSNECLETGATAGAFVANIRQGVWGADNTNPFGEGTNPCIPSASYQAGNDVVAIRRVVATPTATPVDTAVYFRSSYSVGQVFRGTVVPVFSGSPTPLAIFEVKAYVYYISPFTSSATENPLVPALYRVALRADGSMARELVASGIEHLQIQYGRLTTAPDTQYVDSLIGTSYDPAATTWEEVNSVRVWMLARNATAEPGYINTQTYSMGGQDVVKNDGFRRQLFSTVVQLRN